jgi:RNA polymerase nonessential primary-like sigma factor
MNNEGIYRRSDHNGRDLVDDFAESPEDLAARLERWERCLALLLSLKNEDHIDIVHGHTIREKTLDELASRFDVTRERIRQIHLKSLAKLKRHVPKSGPKGTMNSRPWWIEV